MVNKKLILFLGAGASWDSGLPLGDNAASFMIRSCFKNTDLQKIWDDFLRYEANHKSSKWPRFEVVIKTFEDYIKDSAIKIIKTFFDCGISSTVMTLAKLKTDRIWITTNFDNQIELALEKENKIYKVFTDREEIANITEEDLKIDIIIKLHGDATELNTTNNLGVNIEQILRVLPRKTENKLIDLVKVNNNIIFIGYAARDPDLHSFIKKISHVTNEISWIDLGVKSERIKKLIESKINYYPEGTPLALKKIFNVELQKPIKHIGRWEEGIDKELSNFDKQDLLNILADICLIRNDAFSLKKLDIIQNNVIESNEINLFRKKRRQIQSLFHTPQNEVSYTIYHHLDELKALSLLTLNEKLKEEIIHLIADIQWRLKNPHETISIIKGFIKEKKSKSKENVELLILLGIAKIYSGVNNFSQGIRVLKNAKEIAIKKKLPIQSAEASLRLATALIRKSEHKQAEIELHKSKVIFEEIGNPRQIFIWKLNYAECLRIQRKFHLANDTLKQLIKDSELAEDTEVTINALGNKALVSLSLGELLDGDKELKNVVEMASKLETNQEARANALYNRGWLRAICYDWKEAIKYFKLAATSYKEDYYSPERRGGAYSLIGVGYYLLGGKKLSNAILKKIEIEKIIPSSNMHSDYKLLKYLNQNFSITKTQVKRVNRLFTDEPEQLFYFYMMLLKLEPYNVTYLDAVMNSAKIAQISAYWGVIKEFSEKYNLDLEQGKIELIKMNYPGDLGLIKKKLKK
ncbi:MAG: SIR2 family protein [Ignavibacteriaceae bacterium]|nr:SIR2 family protein [Ignavibacteriaceae bacterium]